MGENRENSLSCGRLSTLFVSVWHVCSCLEHTVCVWGSWHLFQIVLVPREHCACVSHMSCLCCGGVTMYKGELFPLWSIIRLDSAVIGQQSFSCALVGWWLFPASRPASNCQHVTLFTLKVPCFAGKQRFFLKCFSSLLISLSNLSATNWLESSAELIRASSS